MNVNSPEYLYIYAFFCSYWYSCIRSGYVNAPNNLCIFLFLLVLVGTFNIILQVFNSSSLVGAFIQDKYDNMSKLHHPCTIINSLVGAFNIILQLYNSSLLLGAFISDKYLFIYCFYNHRDKLLCCSLSSLEHALLILYDIFLFSSLSVFNNFCMWIIVEYWYLEVLA